MNRVISGVILGITALDLLLGYACVHAAQHTYPFSVPFVVTIVLCFPRRYCGSRQEHSRGDPVQNGSVALSIILLFLAVANWPGGDDGPGMLMVGGIGPTLLSAAVLAIVSTVVAVTSRSRVKVGTDKSMSRQQDLDGGRRVSGLAAAALTLSCLSVIVGPLGCLAGVVCGHLARRQFQRDPELGGEGIASAGLIVGYIFIAIYIAILICVIWWHSSTRPM